MASLCPECGMHLCDHTAKERGQTSEQFEEDMRRDMTPEELAAWSFGDDTTKIRAAREIAAKRKVGTFKPTFPK